MSVFKLRVYLKIFLLGSFHRTKPLEEKCPGVLHTIIIGKDSKHLSRLVSSLIKFSLIIFLFMFIWKIW